MPTARELFTAGRLESAIEALGVELRSNPSDAHRRTFLFELLALAGNYDRAEKQLDVLARDGQDGPVKVLPYRAALQAERIREHMFSTGDFPVTPAPAPVAGTLNGRSFSSIEDADPRLGARLEVMAGGRYLWIPFAYISGLRIEPAKNLRDIRWMPAQLVTNESARSMELGEVLLPSLSPNAWQSDDMELRLGRATDWTELPDGDFAPVGQKMLRIDGDLVPLIELRELDIISTSADAAV
jgi:type VI secretion system protein ImpE